MNRSPRYISGALILAAIVVLSNGAAAQSVETPSSMPMDRAGLDGAIRDYIVSHPEVIAKTIEVLEARADAEIAERQKKTITMNKATLEYDASDIVLGNPNGDVTLVEFFDYNCHFCKAALGDMLSLLSNDQSLRIVLKDYPILGPSSLASADVAVAVRRQLTPKRFLDFYTKLLQAKGLVNRRRALEVAREVGANMARLNIDLNKGVGQGDLQETLKLGQALGVKGTPSYVVADERFDGAIGYDAIKAKIDSVRKCGHTICS